MLLAMMPSVEAALIWCRLRSISGAARALIWGDDSTLFSGTGRGCCRLPAAGSTGPASHAEDGLRIIAGPFS